MTDITARAQPGSAIAPRWIIAATMLITAAIGLSGQALATAGEPAHAVVWGSLGFAAYTASLLCLVGSGRGKALGLRRWRFGSWTLLWYCADFGLATLTWVQPQTGTAAEISLPRVACGVALAVMLLSLRRLPPVAFAPRHRRRPVREDRSEETPR